MKLQNKRKKTTIIVASILAVLLVACLILGIIWFTNPMLIVKIFGLSTNNGGNENGETGIRISIYPETQYYVGEEFEPGNFKIQVLAVTDDKSYFVNYGEPGLKISGFDSSVPCESQTVTVTYKEFSTTFNVTIKAVPAPPPQGVKTLESIGLSDNFPTTYTLFAWNLSGPNFNKVKLILYFSDGSTEEISKGIINYCDNVNYNLTEPCTYDLVIRYNYSGTEYTVTVPITITN